MKKATRPNGEYVFHGGCDGCTEPLQVCPGCKYMRPDWNLPDLNPAHIEQGKEKEAMIRKALSLRKEIL